METVPNTTDTPQPRRSLTQRLLRRLPLIAGVIDDAYFNGYRDGVRDYPALRAGITAGAR